jgi:lysophospholipase L1-like esterase
MTRSVMCYHPRIGFTYMPSTRHRVQGANGGYLVRTNRAGFRSDREFETERGPGAAFRALLFGDSQTAGDGMQNPRRYSDLLESAVPGLEIYNYAVSGSGTDQQFLTYQEHRSVVHDLVVIALYVENIRRISRRVLKSRDASGEWSFHAKPYYELLGGELVLRNVPVPKQAWTEATLPAEHLPHVYAYDDSSVFADPSGRHVAILRTLFPAGPVRRAAKAIVKPFRSFQPLPEYDTSDSPSWLLLRSVLTNWIEASRTPVLLVTIPHETAFTQTSDPSNYQARFRELAYDTGCHLYDPLGDLLALDVEARHVMWSTGYGHLSIHGHEALAASLEPVLRTLSSDSLP